MDHRFSVSRVERGIENGGLQLSEQNGISQESIGDFVNNSTTRLHDVPEKIEKRKRSLAQFTREALPRLENYRNSKRALKRPSLWQLHGGDKVSLVIYFQVPLYFFFKILIDSFNADR